MTPLNVVLDTMHRIELLNPFQGSVGEIIKEICWLIAQMFRMLKNHSKQTNLLTSHLMSKQTQKF